MKKFFISSVIILSGAVAARAQVKFGDNPGTINGGSLLELESTNKGLLLTRVNLTKTTVWGLAGTPVNGMTVYNLSTTMTGTAAYPTLKGVKGAYYWDGTAWVGVGNIKIPDQTVEVSGIACDLTTPNPFTGGTFDPATPASEEAIYFNQCDGTTWTYDVPTGQYQRADNIGGTPFYLMGTTTDAQGNKTQQIRRTGSVAIGAKSWAPGAYSLAVGVNDTASGVGSIVFGTNTKSTGHYGITGGINSLSSAPYNVVVGVNDTCTGTGNAMFGTGNKSTSHYGLIAGGGNTIDANAFYSTALGYHNYIAPGHYNHVLGFADSLTSGGSYNFATGRENKVNGSTPAYYNVIGGYGNVLNSTTSSAVFGYNNKDSANYSLVSGNNNSLAPNSTSSVVVGQDNHNLSANATTGRWNFTAGLGNTNGGDRGAIFGYRNTIVEDAIGNMVLGYEDSINVAASHYNFLSGNKNKITGSTASFGNIITGQQNTVVGVQGGAVSGYNNKDSASYTLVSGINNTIGANGGSTIVAGNGNYANAGMSAVFGYQNADSANGYNLMAGANNTSVAPASYSIVVGWQNKNYHTRNAVFGNQNVDSGLYTLMAGGNNTIGAQGSHSIVAGSTNYLNGVGSALFGTNSTILSQYGMVSGFGNTIGTGARFAVAMGSSNTVLSEYGKVIGDSSTVAAGHRFSMALGRNAVTTDSFQLAARFIRGYKFETGTGIGVTVGAGGTSWTSISDRRSKENISNISYGLSTVMALRPTMYNYKGQKNTSLGFIAQEVKEVVPEVVEQTNMGPNHDYLGVKYSELIPVLTKAIQEQQAEIEMLKAENAKLTAKAAVTETQTATVAELSEKVRELQQMMGMSKIAAGPGSKVAKRTK